MSRMLYEVTAALGNATLADEWVRWMLDEHIADVVRAGAESGRLIRLDEPSNTYLVQYEFPSRKALDDYVVHHTPRLRAEATKRFPPDRVTYQRRTGEFLAK